ncbi:MAG: hypothetical protein R3B60_01575 [Candidatus Paceibacterota bacterium]
MNKNNLKSNRLLLTFFLVLLSIFIFFYFTLISQAEEISTTTDTIEDVTKNEQLETIEITKETSTTTNTSSEGLATTTENQSENQEITPLPKENLDETTVTKSALDIEKQKRILNLAANVSNRLDAALYRHEKIITRLERRINKLEQTGRNVSEARLELTLIKDNLTEAKSIMSQINLEVYEAVTSDKPKETWSVPKTSYQATEKIVLENQSKLIKIVNDLKQTPAAETFQINSTVEEYSETEVSQSEQ